LDSLPEVVEGDAVIDGGAVDDLAAAHLHEPGVAVLVGPAVIGDAAAVPQNERSPWEVRPDLPDGGRYEGHDGLRRLRARFDELTDNRCYRPEEFVPVGDDQVVVPLRWGGRGKGRSLNFEERRETWVLTGASEGPHNHEPSAPHG
jgi:hypothetical protein